MHNAISLAKTCQTAETVLPELLTLRQVADLCSVAERTVWGWARDGIAPPALQIGRGTVRYSRTAYLAWIAGGCRPVQGAEQNPIGAID